MHPPVLGAAPSSSCSSVPAKEQAGVCEASAGLHPTAHPERHVPGQLALVAVPRIAAVPDRSKPPTITTYLGLRS